MNTLLYHKNGIKDKTGSEDPALLRVLRTRMNQFRILKYLYMLCIMQNRNSLNRTDKAMKIAL